MKAIAVRPGIPDSVHLTTLAEPSVADVPDGRGVLVQVLQVGVDGTDKEINDAEYGGPPPGYDFLVIGHECLGRVVEVGDAVTELSVGDLVTATVRRPGGSVYDQIGAYDMTTDETYYERGINLLHGYLTEYFVEQPEYLIRVPASLAEVGVLMEPMSIVEKGVAQAFEIQRRLKVWQPRKALVTGSGTIGQLATLVLRLLGLEVVTCARTPAPHRKAELIEALGARYESTQEQPLSELAERYGPFDIVFEATGSAAIAFGAMEVVAKNGIQILTSITAGRKRLEIPADQINLDFVLYNKVMFGTVNANREYFELGVRDFGHAQAVYPGWLSQLLTHPLTGLDSYAEMMRLLTTEKSAIKVYLNVAT